jgi:8-amino-7-oxononanoate synthase
VSRPDPFEPVYNSPLVQVIRETAARDEQANSIPMIEAATAETLFADGVRRINLGSSNYLGLTTHPRVIEASAKALYQFGSGSVGTRLLNGTTSLHLQLEEELADFYGAEAAMVTTSGFLANLALLGSIGAPGDTILVDHRAHASIQAGAQASRATTRTFRHNDMNSLIAELEQAEGGVVVVVDGVYSMHGDVAPLDQLVEICARYGARLVSDEAHGVGVLGERGRGAVEEFGVLDRIDSVTMPLSKALGTCGGAITGSKELIAGLQGSAWAYIFASVNVPAAVAGSLESLRILRESPELVASVRSNSETFRSLLTQAGAAPMPGLGAVISVEVGAETTTSRAWKKLYNAGIYCNASCWPAVGKGKALLRFAVMATHTTAQLEKAAELVALCVSQARAELGE